MDNTQKHIVLAAGGTGGHLFPAESLASELITRGHKVTIITDKRGNAFKSLGDNVRVLKNASAPLKPSLKSKIKFPIIMAWGVFTAFFKIISLKPDVVVGFGGYPSFPPIMAAQILQKPTVLHEQNGILGRANKVVAYFADKIALSLIPTKGIPARSQSREVFTGNPVRAPIVEIAKKTYVAPTQNDTFQILITGGSQAASIFSNVIPHAIKHLPDDLQSRLFIMHQCRAEDLERTKNDYASTKARVDVQTFFGDMADRLEKCHLFIGRSGASTVAEIAVSGRPAIFVPMFHKDMQQKFNAESLTLNGGGWMMMQDEFTEDTLAKTLQHLINHPDLLKQAAVKALTCGTPNAAQKLADLIEQDVLNIKTP